MELTTFLSKFYRMRRMSMDVTSPGDPQAVTVALGEAHVIQGLPAGAPATPSQAHAISRGAHV